MMRVTSLFMGAALLAACGPQTLSDPFEPPQRFDSVGEDGDSGLVSGRIDGRLGRFAVETDDIYGYVGRNRRSVFADLRGQGDGVLMAFLELQNVNPRELSVGDIIEGGMDTMDGRGNGRDGGSVFMFACAGEEDDYWEEDVPAEDVDVEVVDKSEDDGTIKLEYDAVLLDGQTVQGDFVVRLNNLGESE